MVTPGEKLRDHLGYFTSGNHACLPQIQYDNLCNSCKDILVLTTVVCQTTDNINDSSVAGRDWK